MAAPKARVVDGKKFMWDGKEYGNQEEAEKASAEYEKKQFETRVVEEEGKIHVYSRRLVSEVVVDESAPK